VTKNDTLELARRDLAVYAALLYAPFQLAPHVRLIIERLEALERGELTRLCLSLPPRHGKSLLVSQLFPPGTWAASRAARSSPRPTARN
jgi:hypothetical protein